MGALVSVKGLTKRFGELEVLRGIDLEIAQGDVVAVIGPSGCGKSTLLRCLNFLEAPSGGEIRFHGEPVEQSAAALRALRTRVGMVFQRFNLFPHLTVMENLCLAPRVVRGEAPEDSTTRAETLLAKVGLSDKAGEYPERLSGGQQQRVAIARCLMMEPEILLFDEPTSALDPELVGEVLRVIADLAREGATMCIVTHEMGFAREVAGRVLMLDGGVIIEDGPPGELLENPSHPRTRQFLRRVLEKVDE